LPASRSQRPFLCMLDGTAVDISIVGGKGASLGRLVALKAPVPPAFALTIHAYEEHIRFLGTPARASQAADHELEYIRSAILEAEIPPPITAAIAECLEALNQGSSFQRSLAVRSSATAEDSPHFSFAGLHDTVLDVADLSSVEHSVKKCWASLWSDRAVSYRRSGDDTLDTASMAVVIQQLVRCDVSFVVFTADPVSYEDECLVISATYGLGEAIVSGLVTPDHIVIDESGEVARYDIGEKETMIISAASAGGGVREVPVPRILGRAPALTHDQARQIAQIARALDATLGFRLDIEGGIAAGEIFLFQVRPITTLNGHSTFQQKQNGLFTAKY